MSSEVGTGTAGTEDQRVDAKNYLVVSTHIFVYVPLPNVWGR